VNFSEQPPSKQWAALKYRGEKFAEVWFKPEGEPFALTFRVPRSGFQLPGAGQWLAIENLLKAVGIATGEVESWHGEGASHSGTDVPDSDLKHPLPPPPQGAPHLSLYVRLKPPQPIPPTESGGPEIHEAKWQYLESRWNAILGLEASVDNLRVSMEGLRIELEASSRKALPVEAKLHALSADVVQWNKAKSRIHYALPKMREFTHRATWATGTPERKKLTELFEKYIQPRVPFPQIDEVIVQFESLLKDRQTLSAQGMAVYQECKGISAEFQSTLRTLQSNAAANAARKKSAKSTSRKSL
jgi:hypothetical protein